jgi:hypothetical protein
MIQQLDPYGKALFCKTSFLKAFYEHNTTGHHQRLGDMNLDRNLILVRDGFEFFIHNSFGVKAIRAMQSALLFSMLIWNPVADI